MPIFLAQSRNLRRRTRSWSVRLKGPVIIFARGTGMFRRSRRARFPVHRPAGGF
jgi:hypothetical protein